MSMDFWGVGGAGNTCDERLGEELLGLLVGKILKVSKSRPIIFHSPDAIDFHKP